MYLTASNKDRVERPDGANRAPIYGDIHPSCGLHFKR
jgi:hypothetical protein